MQHKISPVPSHEYGDRFLAFLKAVMRGGEGGESFLPKEERDRLQTDEKAKGKERAPGDQVAADGQVADGSAPEPNTQ